MARRLMNLRHVPDDEAEEVRALLAELGFDTYETPPSRWGLSMGAIWLRDESQLPAAREALARYQRERRRKARETHEQQKRDGTAETMAGLFRRDPLRVILYLALVGGILYFSIRPFFSFGGD
ncbi:MAG: DUF6164 family protein [Halovenus sp.]